MDNPNNKRIQLTLFVNETNSEQIEKVRSKFNPKQFDIIKSHVTLCREDELINLEPIEQNIKKIGSFLVTLNFEKPIRFNEEKGVLLPVVRYETFQELRKLVLKGLINNPRNSEPHITLMHPRNSSCSDKIFEEINNISFPTQLTFSKISLIEQEMGKKWNIIKEFDLD